MKWIRIALVSAAAISACSPKPEKSLLSDRSASAPTSAVQPAAAPAPAPAAPSIEGIPAGEYTFDKAHTSLIFRVSHMGYSNFTAAISGIDGKLQFDPAKPGDSRIMATVDPNSLAFSNPPKGFLEQIKGEEFLDAKKFPAITFTSTSVELTGPATAKVTGDLTLHGVTKPLTLDVTFNGGYGGMAQDPHARIGFSAKGSLKRSDYGVSFGIPTPGSNMG
ncbi:MAG TPA: YceI family protein, partial [Hyphomonadaceae bacterium]|nr:YceI family protein [Hyphomonadaceae bacterium]